MEVQIEPFGSIRTVRFDRVTGPTAGFGGSWPVLILNGLISRSDRNCDRSTVEPVGPAGPVRFFKHWFLILFTLKIFYLLNIKKAKIISKITIRNLNIFLK